MVTGLGGAILGAGVVGPSTPGTGTPSVISGIGTNQVVLRSNYFVASRGAEFSVSIPPDCGPFHYSSNQVIINNYENESYELPIMRVNGSPSGGAIIIDPSQVTIASYKREYEYLGASWEGTHEGPHTDTPNGTQFDIDYHFYAPDGSGSPIIPDEDKTSVPIEFNNGSGVPIRICIDGVCTDLDVGEDLTYDWLTYEGDSVPDLIVTYPGCPLCPPVFPVWPEWNPYDPGDPTNCTPAPGVTCPVFQIYIPPPITIPDPEPEPEPEPEGGSGNEGNFQGCIANPCEIPYLYTHESK